jgi:transcriptional antiterminator RfaH
MAPEQPWFALYTNPHKEYLVRERLRDQGIEVYLPEVRTASRRRDRRGKRPFFPQYLFARFDLQSALAAKVRYTPGLCQIVSAGGTPIPIPNEIVAYIHQRLAPLVETEPTHDLREGDQVCITHGPYEGFDAVFDSRLSTQGRLQALIRWMGTWGAAEVSVEDLLTRSTSSR